MSTQTLHHTEERATPNGPLVFVFSGQGTEWWSMGQALYAQEPAFATAIHDCDAALKGEANFSICSELLAPQDQSRLEDVEVLQPLLFSLHVALTSLLRHWGVSPDMVVGHSFGEVSAAWAAGAISLTDAMRIHARRSRLMKRLRGHGRMVLLETSAERATRSLVGFEDHLAIGVINSPKSVVLSGESVAVSKVLERLSHEGIAQRALPMPYAVHSPAMHALASEVCQQVADLTCRTPNVPLFSTVTGGEVHSLDVTHWARNIGMPADFQSAVASLLARGARTFVEIGPHPVLGILIAQCAEARGLSCRSVPTLRRHQPEREALLSALGELRKHGYAIPFSEESQGRGVPSAGVEQARSMAADLPDPRILDQLRTLSGPARHARLLAYLGEFVGHRTQLIALDANTPLRELGLDSARAVELAVGLSAALSLSLPATFLFEHPTLAAAAEALLRELGLLAIHAAAGDVVSAAVPDREPIAIVGIGCRFPGGVASPQDLWRLLENEVDAVAEISPSRCDVARHFSRDVDSPGTTYSKWAGMLEQVDRFDAGFFGIAPREAQSMDPQQRLLLEVAWEALEHAGIIPASLFGSRTGVFVGICTNDYGGPLLYGPPAAIDTYTFTGNSISVAAGRIAYVLGLNGPALSIDTACSSSLVALHLACRSLRQGECDAALAAGVNLILSPALFVYFSRLRALSPTGRSRAFDASADGYVRGEGCGVVVLKRLSAARAAGDQIYAVVQGSAVNQDGRSSGLTAPSVEAQKAVLRAALRDADMSPARVGYVEAHGTGTPLGDPIELRALSAVLREGRAAADRAWVGSIKTNLGHTEGAAGIAGVIKAALALHHKRIPRSLHFTSPNPHVDWTDLPLRVANTSTAWNGEAPRVAGVSSFGFSGTNAHIVLLEAPAPAPETVPQRAMAPAPLPILLSGRSDAAVTEQAQRLAQVLTDQPEMSLVDLAGTLASARTHFEHRAAVLVRTREELLQSLQSGRLRRDRVQAGGLALLFSGQGSQRPQMGAGLYAQFPAFRSALDEVVQQLDPLLAQPLLPLMWAPANPALDETGLTQPALFALQVALFRLLQSWGLVPSFLVGHSVGEIAAMHVAGVFDLSDACTLVAARGRLMQALPRGGSMLALEAQEEELTPYLRPGEVELAAVNSPTAVVVAGHEQAVAALAAMFQARGRRSQRLRVSHAFHSAFMDGMLDEYTRVASTLRFAPPQIPIVSTLSGQLVSPTEVCTPEYFRRQARSPVRFAAAVQTLAAAAVTKFVELGPQAVLSVLAKESVGDVEGSLFLSALGKDGDEGSTVCDAVLRLHLRGTAFAWGNFFAPLSARRVLLPSYPFQRQRHFIESKPAEPAAPASGSAEHPWLRTAIQVAGRDETLIPGCIPESDLHWLREHEVAGSAILPGTAFIDLAWEAAGRVSAEIIEELTLEAPLPLGLQGSVEIQVSLVSQPEAQGYALTLFARQGAEPWRRQASGRLRKKSSSPAAWDQGLPTFHAWPPPDAKPLSLSGMYEQLSAAGLSYGAAFRRVTAAWRCGDELCVEVRLDAASPAYSLHPTLLDAALHPYVAAQLGADLALPFCVMNASLYARGATALRVRLSRCEGGITLCAGDSSGALVASMQALLLRPLSSPQRGLLHRLVWSEINASPPQDIGELAVCGAEIAGLRPVLQRAGARVQPFSDVSALCSALAAGAAPPQAILFHDATADATTAATHALQFLQRALSEPQLAGTRLVLLSQRALSAGIGDVVENIAQAGLAGWARSTQAEHPQRVLQHIDLDGDARSYLAVPAALQSGEPQVAVRQGRLKTVKLAPAQGAAGRTSRGWATAGTVLITGGTGALGTAVARHLVRRHGVVDLVLCSRQGEQAAGSGTLRSELAQSGARVRWVACDMGDRGAVAQLVATLPRLSGVIHAAGVREDGVLLALDAVRVQRVFRAKVDGALHLHALTQDRALDFFVLFSSVAAVLGPAGQAAYAAANSVLDALAHFRRRHGLAGQSIHFGPWAEVGMAARLRSVDQDRLTRLGLGRLTVPAALAGLDDAIAREDPQIAVALLNRSTAGSPATSALAEKQDASAALLAMSPSQRQQTLREWVQRASALVLGSDSREDLPADRPLRELGLDSLTAVELRNALAQRLGRSLPATLLFDYPDVNGLTRYLSELLVPSPVPAVPGRDSVDELTEGELDALLTSLQGTP